MISSHILSADDTSVIISNPDPLLFLNSVTEVLNKLKLWFNTNFLFLNFSKTEFMKFNKKNAYEQDIKILYDNTEICNSSCIKFLGFNVANSLFWKNHIDSLIPKLSSACYAIRAIKTFVNQEDLLRVYYAYFHSTIRYGVIFWGNSSYTISVFYLQEKMIRIITGTGNRTSCKQSFIAVNILILIFIYLFTLMFCG
jgi:hypothetical protein